MEGGGDGATVTTLDLDFMFRETPMSGLIRWSTHLPWNVWPKGLPNNSRKIDVADNAIDPGMREQGQQISTLRLAASAANQDD